MDRRNLPKLADFPVISEDKIRYSDTDRQGHVNNAVFSSFLETGRVEILYCSNEKIQEESCSFVIASIKLDYIEEINWPGTINIGTLISKIGNSSIIINQGLFQNDKCVAIAETVIVQVNDETRKPQIFTEKSKAKLIKYLTCND